MRDIEKGVYFGAGIDVEPYTRFPEVKLWISVDSQPASFHGFAKPGKSWYAHSFIGNLDKEMEKVGFLIEKVEKDLRIYTAKTGQKVMYYTNTALPSGLYKNPRLASDLRGWQTIYLAGYMPPSCVLEFAARRGLRFIGNTHTIYESDEDDIREGKINSLLDSCCNSRRRFVGFEYMTDTGVEKFDSWEEFVERSEERFKRVNHI